MEPRRTKLHATAMDCLHCGSATDFSPSVAVEVTLEAYLDKRRGKKLMRVIELDADGYSRKWSGTYIAHDSNIIRDDGKGHPHINCEQCGKVNVFGLEEKGDDPADGIIQVLGRSDADIRLLERLENGKDQGDGHHRLVREEYPSEKGLATGSRAESNEGQAAGDGDRNEGT